METIDKNIFLLIENMSGIHDKNEATGSLTLSWNAYQIAREVNDISLVPQILSLIDRNDDTRLKKYAYQLLLFILSNTKDNALANLLLLQLRKEDTNDDCLYTLLMGLWESNINLENHIEDVIFYIDDQRELVRNAALRLLRLYKNNQQIAENALIEIVKSPYDNYDLRYATETLAVIGSKKSIETLEEAKNETDNKEIQQLILETVKKLKQQ